MSDRNHAIKFLNSMRGQYIVSQALCLAVKEINSREPTRQEPSNVADMEFLIEHLFPIYRAIEVAEPFRTAMALETGGATRGEVQDEFLGDLVKKAKEDLD